MSARWVVRCRATTARFEATKIRRSRVPERKEERQKISRHRGPKFSFVHEQSPAGFCSIAPARFGVFGLPVWNETGRLLALNRFLSPPRRMRNGSRSQSTSRSQSQRPRSACSLSCLVQSSKRCQFSNIFLGINQGRDCSRSHAFGRHDARNITRRRHRKPRLFDSGCHYGSREQQRCGKEVAGTRNLDCVPRIN